MGVFDGREERTTERLYWVLSKHMNRVIKVQDKNLMREWKSNLSLDIFRSIEDISVLVLEKS